MHHLVLFKNICMSLHVTIEIAIDSENNLLKNCMLVLNVF